MQYFDLRVLLLISAPLFALSACSRPGEQFIGTWCNGGPMCIVVSRADDNFILKSTVNDRTVGINSARFENGYLTSENILFKKLAYIESEDAIQPLDLDLPIFLGPPPTFRRVKN